MDKLYSYVEKTRIPDCDIESIIRSKITRWARDASNNRYGFHSANDLAKYIDNNPGCLDGLIIYDPNSK